MIDAFALSVKPILTHCLEMLGEGPCDRNSKNIWTKRMSCQVKGRSANIASQMKSAQVFVLSSALWRNVECTIEAMYPGLPVISTKVSDVKELIIDHINGCFTDDANSTYKHFHIYRKMKTAAREIGLRASNTIKHLVWLKIPFCSSGWT